MRTIFYHGRVYTGSSKLAEAFAVEDGQFTFVGSDLEALSLPGEKIDLQGRFVCPGFNDSHMHLLGYGRTLCTAPLAEHTASLQEMLDCLRDFLPQAGNGILIGRGWNQDHFSDVRRMPNRWDLDQVSTVIPVCAIRACGHALSVNSLALQILGITSSTPQPEGGQIVMENGEPNGVFLDSAMDLVYGAVPPPDKQALKDMILSACSALNAYGVTSCQSDDYSSFRTLPWQLINEAYRELEQEGKLTVRVYEQANFTDGASLREFIDQGNLTGTGTEFFRIGPLKMLGDGALGARTAYLSRPYADAPDTCGISVFSQEAFDEMIGLAHEAGMQVAVHAIGDACLDRVLSSIRKALSAAPRPDHRHGIVHCQITRPEQLEQIAELELHAYAQTIFLDYDTTIVRDRVGDVLASSSYCWKTLMNAGVTVSNGTDAPVEAPRALAGIQCAVTRAPLNGSESFLPDQAFTVQEALDSYTSSGARASFEEHIKGKIQAGMLADFVILGEDPFTTDPSQISRIPILSTYLGGQNVYSA